MSSMGAIPGGTCCRGRRFQVRRAGLIRQTKPSSVGAGMRFIEGRYGRRPSGVLAASARKHHCWLAQSSSSLQRKVGTRTLVAARISPLRQPVAPVEFGSQRKSRNVGRADGGSRLSCPVFTLTPNTLRLSTQSPATGVSVNLCARRNMTKRNRYTKQKDHEGGRVSGVA